MNALPIGQPRVRRYRDTRSFTTVPFQAERERHGGSHFMNTGSELVINFSFETRVKGRRLRLPRRGARAAEWGALLRRCPSYSGPWVQIPPSPPVVFRVPVGLPPPPPIVIHSDFIGFAGFFAEPQHFYCILEKGQIDRYYLRAELVG